MTLCVCCGHPRRTTTRQDVGGEARPLPGALLPLLTYVAPNELELQAITGGLPTDTEGQVRWHEGRTRRPGARASFAARRQAGGC
jgi:hypothetical protein